ESVGLLALAALWLLCQATQPTQEHLSRNVVMRLEKEVILERFTRTEAGLQRYRDLADEYEAMWRLDPGYKTSREQALLEGREQIVVPTTYNVVNLAQRLLSNEPRINVIPDDPTEQGSVESAELC